MPAEKDRWIYRNQDADAIKKAAQDQFEAGNYIDVNAGIFVDKEAEYPQWLVKRASGCWCHVLLTALTLKPSWADRASTTNSWSTLSLESECYENCCLLSQVLISKLSLSVWVMTVCPETTAERLEIADKLVNGLVKNNVPIENSFIDPLYNLFLQKIHLGLSFSMLQMKSWKSSQSTVCGLSNISYGLPVRSLNQTFAVMAIAKGLDGLIINPLDKKMMANIIAAETLTARDSYCGKYLKSYRKKKFDFLLNKWSRFCTTKISGE